MACLLSPSRRRSMRLTRYSFVWWSPIIRNPIRDELRRWTWCWRCAGQGYVGDWGLPIFWEHKLRRKKEWELISNECPKCHGTRNQGPEMSQEKINVLHDLEA